MKPGTGVWYRSEKFGYIVLMYYTNGRFEDNCALDDAEDLFEHLLDHWKFRWLYGESKGERDSGV